MSYHIIQLMTSEFIIGKLSIDDDKMGVSLEDIVKLSFDGEDLFLSEFNIFTNDKITYISYDKILTINNLIISIPGKNINNIISSTLMILFLYE